MCIKIVIPGIPIACERPRFRRMGNRLIVYDKQADQKAFVRKQIMEQTEKMLEGDDKRIVMKASNLSATPTLEIDLYFYLPMPKRRAKALEMRCNKKPDLDNLVKFIFDVGNKVLWSDDRFICALKTAKFYATEPRTEIFIYDTCELKKV